MRIQEINLYRIILPFTGDFSISRLKGVSSDTVVVEVVSDRGRIKGYGEGLPVQFVTGETPENVMETVRHFANRNSFPWELNDVFQIWDLIDSLPGGKDHNAAICAIEMALLDILGKSQNKSIIEYFPSDFYTDIICYGGAITLGNRERIIEICQMIRDLGINHLRIKLGGNFKQNKYAVETARLIFGGECELRIDPNGVWDRDLAFKHIPLIQAYNVKVVEEPMIKSDPGFTEFAATMKDMDVMMMACESAPTLEDVEEIIREGYYQVINIKLCRSGGFRRSLRMVERIRKSGLSFQIGCTLGESGILSAAGRVLCLLCGDAMYYDGSYDEFLLKENITRENVSFGYGGEAGPLDGPGLGVEVNMQSLERLCNGSSTISITRP